METDKRTLIRALVTVFTPILALTLALFLNYVTSPVIYAVLENLLAVLCTAFGIMTVAGKRQDMHAVAAVLTIAPGILYLGQLWLFGSRLYFILLYICLLCSLILLLAELPYYLTHKYKIRDGDIQRFVANGIIPFSFVGIVLFFKSLHLIHLTKTEMPKVSPLLIVTAFLLATVATVLFAVLKKDKSDKKRFIGALLGICCTTLFLSLIIPFLTAQNINYALDTSTPIAVEAKVVQKRTSSSASHKGGPHFKLILSADGKNFEFTTLHTVYGQYESGDRLTLYKYNGALGYTYYEYRLEEVYRYP